MPLALSPGVRRSLRLAALTGLGSLGLLTCGLLVVGIHGRRDAAVLRTARATLIAIDATSNVQPSELEAWLRSKSADPALTRRLDLADSLHADWRINCGALLRAIRSDGGINLAPGRTIIDTLLAPAPCHLTRPPLLDLDTARTLAPLPLALAILVFVFALGVQALLAYPHTGWRRLVIVALFTLPSLGALIRGFDTDSIGAAGGGAMLGLVLAALILPARELALWVLSGFRDADGKESS